MHIAGFQKLTLLDYPGKLACILFTSGCNFRCPFCHNASLVTRCADDFVDKDEILRYLKKRLGVLEGVCISGGEPLLQPDLPEFLREIKNLGYPIKLDTNGTNPTGLKKLLDEGLVDYVAMDIKNSPEKYSLTAFGKEGAGEELIGKVFESIKMLLESDYSFEFRTTVVKEFHTIGDIRKIAELIKGAPKYYLQNFVDSGDVISGHLSPVSDDDMKLFLEEAKSVLPCAQIRG